MSSKAAFVACLSGLHSSVSYIVIVVILIACGLGLPVPEDITLLLAGILAAFGEIHLVGAIVVCFLGVLIGDTILFFIGRKMGRRVFQVRFLKRFFSEKRIILAEKKITENSKFICFVARFLPGLRAPIFLTAGVLGVKPAIFLLLDGLAALISVPAWVYIGYWLGDQWEENWYFVKQAQIYLIIGVVLLVIGYIVFKKYPSKK